MIEGIVPRPSEAAIASASTNDGKARKTSVTRMIARDTAAPSVPGRSQKPAMRPSAPPVRRANPAMRNPIARSRGSAVRTRERTSLPARSVPKKCSSEGGWAQNDWLPTVGHGRRAFGSYGVKEIGYPNAALVGGTITSATAVRVMRTTSAKPTSVNGLARSTL